MVWSFLLNTATCGIVHIEIVLCTGDTSSCFIMLQKGNTVQK